MSGTDISWYIEDLLGSNTISFKVVDAAGNSSVISGTHSYVIDQELPAAVATVETLSQDTGTSNTDRITNIATQVVGGSFSAALAAGEKIQVSSNTTDGSDGDWYDATVWYDTNTSQGHWLAPVVLSSADNSALYVRTVDTAGNVTYVANSSDFGDETGLSYTLDTVKPSHPTLALALDSGISGDGITNNGQINVSLAETLDAGGEGGYWEYNVNNTGWNLGSGTSFIVTGDGAKSVLVRQIDAAGNVGESNSPFTFTLASVTSLSNVTVDLKSTSDTGTSDTDNITNDTTPTFSINLTGKTNLSEGQVIEIVDASGNVVADYEIQSGDLSAGAWNVGAIDITSGSSITQGNYAFKAQINDSGTLGAASDIALLVTLDTTAPTAVATTASVQNTANAVVKSSEAGTAYLVKDSVTVSTLSDITSAADNNFNSVAITAANTDTNLAATGLVDGTYKVYTVDAAGNLSTASINTVTVDTTAPSASLAAGLTNSPYF